MKQAQKTLKLYKEGHQWEAFKSYQSDKTATNPSMTILQFIGNMDRMVRIDEENRKAESIDIVFD